MPSPETTSTNQDVSSQLTTEQKVVNFFKAFVDLKGSLQYMLDLDSVDLKSVMLESDEGTSQFSKEIDATRNMIDQVVSFFILFKGHDHFTIHKTMAPDSMSDAFIVSEFTRCMATFRDVVQNLFRENEENIQAAFQDEVKMKYLSETLGRLSAIDIRIRHLDSKLKSAPIPERKKPRRKQPASLKTEQAKPSLRVVDSPEPFKPPLKSIEKLRAFHPFLEDQKNEFDSPLQYTIACELVLEMEKSTLYDKQGFKFHDLYLLLKRKNQGENAVSKYDLERELILLKQKLKTMGIDLKGTLKRQGKNLIRLIWIKSFFTK